MDQERLAGVGNLLADEILWRADLDPERRTPLRDDELRHLHSTLRRTLPQLARAGARTWASLWTRATPTVAAPATGPPSGMPPWAGGAPTGARCTSTERRRRQLRRRPPRRPVRCQDTLDRPGPVNW